MTKLSERREAGAAAERRRSRERNASVSRFRVTRWVEEQPDAQFLVADDATLTYAELDRATRDTAARLASRGVVKGTRVGVMLPSSAAWAVAALAVARIGGVVVTLSTLLRPPELAAQLRTAAVEHLLVTPEFRGRRYLEDLREIAPTLAPQAEAIFDPHCRGCARSSRGRSHRPPRDPCRPRGR